MSELLDVTVNWDVKLKLILLSIPDLNIQVSGKTPREALMNLQQSLKQKPSRHPC